MSGREFLNSTNLMNKDIMYIMNIIKYQQKDEKIIKIINLNPKK
jgi:hypothetical protein